MTYQEFLESKTIIAPVSGFDIPAAEVNPAMSDHSREVVKWLVRGGRRATFSSFGLGKTSQQLEFCAQVTRKLNGKALIVLPLGVKQEFAHDAVELLGMAEPPYIKSMAEAQLSDADILLTNYERVRDGDIDPKEFIATSLDEASVLRSFGSKIYQTFLDKFRGVPYKCVATATPSPNKLKELIHYAGYLEVMDTGQALTRFFKRDSTKANNLTLYPHKEEEFWLWVASWALFITKPSDLGFSDEGYDLPPMDIRYHEIPVDHSTAGADRYGQMRLVRDAAKSLADCGREKRESITERVAEAKKIIESEPAAHFILWHDLEEERHEIRRQIPAAVEIYGSMDLDERERRVIDFSEGRTQLFATKKILSGSGCNFQRHCHRAIFVGIDYKFNDFIQAIHRIYRFLQTEKVQIDIIYMESEREILAELKRKWREHDELQARMAGIVRKYGLSRLAIEGQMKRSIGVKRVKVTGKYFEAYLNDCVQETQKMPDNSVDLIHTSIPFGNHYEYTPSYNDFGHNEDTERFMQQMDYLSPNLLRILRPGRVLAVHVKDRVLFGNATGTGMPTIEPFHALTIMHYKNHGFEHTGMITVLTDVVRENNQTYRLGWSEQCKDGSKMGVGCPEYILLFRKLPSDTSRAYADVPVEKSKDEYTRAQWQIDAHSYWRSSGDRYLSKDELAEVPVNQLQKVYRKFSRENVYDYAEHVTLAKELDKANKLPASFMVVSPGSWSESIWDDILRMKTLNAKQEQKNLQMHVCPLQIDIVDRIINRFSNPGDVVMDPFAGLFTVPMRAVELGRRGIGIELNADYFRDGMGYMKQAEERRDAPTLFDLLEAE